VALQGGVWVVTALNLATRTISLIDPCDAYSPDGEDACAGGLPLKAQPSKGPINISKKYNVEINTTHANRAKHPVRPGDKVNDVEAAIERHVQTLTVPPRGFPAGHHPVIQINGGWYEYHPYLHPGTTNISIGTYFPVPQPPLFGPGF
jgi:hypothetical protein